jgi:hypothetical protein
MKPDAPALYEDGKNNTLLNDVFFYVLHHLPRLQNMHEYSVDAGQDIEAFVKRKYPQLEGPPSVPPVFFFSKNLLAYLETLVAFSPYYRADDARMAGKMEAFYQEAINRYKAYTDDKLHGYITGKLTKWCDLYRPKRPSTESADKEDIDGEVGDVVNADGGDGGGGGGASFQLTDDESGEEEPDAPRLVNAAAPAPAAAPAAAAESGSDGAGSPAAGGADKS